MAKQKYKFERLTPIDNMDLDVYEEAIDYVFSNSDVKNVVSIRLDIENLRECALSFEDGDLL